ncbi:hypothetical protein EDD15DRAFT_1780434 [Pisolithus albus]|nr:hypothetical protein EDD15DRAFT_1780434 [Pisolithus albus]
MHIATLFLFPSSLLVNDICDASVGNCDGLRLLARDSTENWGIPFRSCPVVGVCTSSSHSSSMYRRGGWGGHTLGCLPHFNCFNTSHNAVVMRRFCIPLAEKSSPLRARIPVNSIQSHPSSHTVSSTPAVDRTDHEHTVFRHGCAMYNVRMVFHARACAPRVFRSFGCGRHVSYPHETNTPAGLRWPYLYFRRRIILRGINPPESISKRTTLMVA